MSIRIKLFLILAIILIPSFLVVGYQEKETMTKTIQGEALEKAKSDLQTGLAILDLQYPGDWNIRRDQLYKGDTLINGNYDIVDKIGKLTNGDTVTIFHNDTRVTTNVMTNGQRAIGTKVSEVVAETVLKKGEVFIGQANVVGHTYQSAYMPIKDSTGKIIGIWYVGAPDASERILAIEKNVTTQIIIQASVIIAVALLLNFLFTRPILRRIQSASDILEWIASGDLTQKEIDLKGNDETGKLLKSATKVRQDLREILTKIKDSTTQVATSSEELAAIAEENSAASEQISRTIQEVASGSERQLSSFMDANQAASEISKGMEQVSRSIQTVTHSSAVANEKAGNGAETVSQTIEQMNVIQQAVEETAVVIDSLGEKSKEIGQFVEVITKIAKQTNLLALNAAIEAARAGEQGRGFAIVADEVKQLAEQSAKAAEEIRELIHHVQTESNKAVESMNQGTEVVQEGILRVHQTGQAFEEIVHSIAEISTHSQEVTSVLDYVHERTGNMARTVEYAADISKQSSGNTHHVASAAEEQNASMEEIASYSESLSKLVEELQVLINRFKV